MSSLAASIRSLGVTPISSGVSTGADQVRPPSSDFEMARWFGTPLQPPGEGGSGSPGAQPSRLKATEKVPRESTARFGSPHMARSPEGQGTSYHFTPPSPEYATKQWY